MLEDKISSTSNLIKDCLNASNSPVGLCSFGKDSLVMIHLILQIKKIPVIFWKEPFFQKKFSYAHKIAELWDLDVYDYPPQSVQYFQNNGFFDVLNFYRIGLNNYIYLNTGVRSFKEDDDRFLCTIDDLIKRPVCSNYSFNWDCIFHGHKQNDPLYGLMDNVELPQWKILDKGIISFPLKDWSDKDIWNYIHEFKLPYNKERYDHKYESSNNDIFPCCYRCLDQNSKDKEVYCPKKNKYINRVERVEENNNRVKEFLDKTSKDSYLCLK